MLRNFESTNKVFFFCEKIELKAQALLALGAGSACMVDSLLDRTVLAVLFCESPARLFTTFYGKETNHTHTEMKQCVVQLKCLFLFRLNSSCDQYDVIQLARNARAAKWALREGYV